MVGVVLQRALLLTTVVSAAVAALWTHAQRLLLLFRQDPALSVAAARYIQMATPALWFAGEWGGHTCLIGLASPGRTHVWKR
jgi:MATE family multidrug resistance protein